MRVDLAIIYWGHDPFREAAFDKVFDAMSGYDFCDYIRVTDPGPPFNRGRARNLAMSAFQDFETDVGVILDADSIPERDPLIRAILGAANEGGIHFPHTAVSQLNKLGTEAFRYGPSAGGCWVARPENWFGIGGMEERGGYSVDDRTFLEQMKAWNAGPHYHEGILTCLWHPPEGRIVPPEDRVLIQRYLDAKDVWDIQKLIDERP